MTSGTITLDGKDLTRMSIHKRNLSGISHIPEDRHKHGLVLDDTLENNLVSRATRIPVSSIWALSNPARSGTML